MGFMIPVAERMVMYHVETNAGTELVPEDVCGALEHESQDPLCADCVETLLPYLEGNRVEGYEPKEGWYGRLSAPGYLDATHWDGPYRSADEALDAVKEFYEVDDNGDDLPDEP